MKWNDQELETWGAFADALYEIFKGENAQENADKFMAAYIEEVGEKIARANVGYLTGYFEPDDMANMMALFNSAHPIFGMAVPTPEAAFKMGEEWATTSQSETKN